MTTNYDLGFQAALKRADEIALCLEEKWRNSAKRHRETNRRWFFGWFTPTLVERDARSIEAAADGIKAIRKVVSEQTPLRVTDGEN